MTVWDSRTGHVTDIERFRAQNWCARHGVDVTEVCRVEFHWWSIWAHVEVYLRNDKGKRYLVASADPVTHEDVRIPATMTTRVRRFP